MTKISKVPIQPSSGYILVKPYIPKNTIFKSGKETAGDDQFSTVLAVGGEIMDDHGNIRSTDAKVGDIIIHASSNKTFEEGHELYRFVHFTEVHGKFNG